jgi:hypothetical protein
MFTKIQALNSIDCEYTILGVVYHGCQYKSSTIGWLTQLNITNLGPFSIPSGSIINVKMYLTNSWSSYPFAHNQYTASVVNSLDNYISQGVVSLGSLYPNLKSFSLVDISNDSLIQTSTSANSANTLTLKFNLQVPIAAGSLITILLPKDSYSLSGSNSNYNVSEDISYYFYKFNPICSQVGQICKLANENYSISIDIMNNKYVKNVRNSIITYV